jgi:glycosyltransferase 2 family protein
MTTVEADADANAAQAPEPQRKSIKAQVITWGRRLLVVAVLAFAIYQLVTNWSEVWRTLSGIAWESAVLSMVSVIVSMFFGVMAWQTVVDSLGKPIGIVRGAQINLVGMLGKYVPGSVWAYVLQMELGRKAGLARARVFTSALVQIGISIVASLMLGALALPVILDETPDAVWLFALLPIGLIALHPMILTWGHRWPSGSSGRRSASRWATRCWRSASRACTCGCSRTRSARPAGPASASASARWRWR